jgi:uncharacterized protein (TIRG00374 family)
VRVIFLSRVVRAAVAIGLTAVVLSQIDARSILRAVDQARPAPLVAAVALVMIDRALMGWRWVALLGVIDAVRRPALGPAMRLFFVSTFLGTFLPASIGGDAIRAVGTTRLGVPAGEAAASVLLDRLLGVIGLLVLAAIGLVLGRKLTTEHVIVWAFAFTAAVAGAGAAWIFSDRAAAAAHRVARVVPSARLRTLAADLIAAIQRHRTHRRRLAAVLAASIVVQMLRVLEAWTLGLALTIRADLTMYFAFVPLILLIMLLPITVNGIGTSQAAFVWMFGAVGIEPAAAFTLSVLFLALGVVGNLPGALLYATGPPTRRDDDLCGSA